MALRAGLTQGPWAPSTLPGPAPATPQFALQSQESAAPSLLWDSVSPAPSLHLAFLIHGPSHCS